MFLTKRDMAVSHLRDAIIKGSLSPGTRLILEELAGTFNLSLTPIREALSVLEAEGFVAQHPHKGAVVTPLDRDDVMELYAIRIAVEALTTRHAVSNVTEADVDKMAAMCHSLETFQGDWEEFLTIDRGFHLVLYRAAGRQRWVETIETLWRRSVRYMLATTAMAGATDAIHADHRAIVQACRARDAEKAETVIRTHLARSEKRLLTEWP